MEIARYWRLNGQRYSLHGAVCTYCGKPNFTQRPVCDACNGTPSDGVSTRKPIANREIVSSAELGGK
jgi:uncharacterized OB-fold protein